ncbi:MAG TPA: biotin/lipoyl-containing protein [Dehalococcoidia bacterium]|nr:biotin/lipoyl-containing protein [Dehalococcoidia bacterium]
MARTYTLTIDGRSVEVEVWREGNDYGVRIGANAHAISLGMIDDGQLFSLLMDGASYEVHSSRTHSGYDLLVRNELFHVEIERGGRPPESAYPGPESGARALHAPMTGIVAEVVVAQGQSVERGAVVLILESMKMKNELRADEGGVVERVDVQAGQQVERGQALLQIRSGG